MAIAGVAIGTILLAGDVSLSLERIVGAAPAAVVEGLTSRAGVSGRAP